MSRLGPCPLLPLTINTHLDEFWITSGLDIFPSNFRYYDISPRGQAWAPGARDSAGEDKLSPNPDSYEMAGNLERRFLRPPIAFGRGGAQNRRFRVDVSQSLQGPRTRPDGNQFLKGRKSVCGLKGRVTYDHLGTGNQAKAKRCKLS